MENLEQIRNLFQHAGFRSRLEKAQSNEEALGIVVTAGAAKQISFSPDSVNRLMGVFSSPREKEPHDKELKGPSGQRMAETHSHMSCCTDCPGSAALCC